MAATTSPAPWLAPPISEARSTARRSRTRKCAEGRFVLPGGYVGEDGTAHYEVELSAVTGEEESYLASLEPGASRAAMVTGLLARCVKRIGARDDVDPTLVRDLLVGDRDYLILKLREATFGDTLSCVLHCPDPGCGKPMSLSLDPAGFAFAGAPVRQRFFTLEVPVPGRSERGTEAIHVEFRLPTGGDQEALASLFADDPAAAEEELLARCLRRVGECDGIDRALVATLPEGVRGAIEAAMDQWAPLVELELEAVCPECRRSFETLLDFTTLFLDELTANLRSLEREVHFLAWHYHWSEQDILAMTRKKRQRYVALVQEEVDRLSHVW
jgi:hypothetical protein